MTAKPRWKKVRAESIGLAWAIRSDRDIGEPFLWGIFYKHDQMVDGINTATWNTRAKAMAAKKASSDRVVLVEWTIREILPRKKGKI